MSKANELKNKKIKLKVGYIRHGSVKILNLKKLKNVKSLFNDALLCLNLKALSK